MMNVWNRLFAGSLLLLLFSAGSLATACCVAWTAWIS